MVGIITESFPEQAPRRKGLRRGKSGQHLHRAMNRYSLVRSCPGKSVPKT